MNITSQTRVGDIVRENFNAASVLTRMKIDYCCGGNRTLVTACDEVGADIGNVIRKLDQAMIVRDFDTGHVQSMPPDELCDYIIKRHHMYVRDKIPVLTVSIDKLCNVHGKSHPELFKVKDHLPDCRFQSRAAHAKGGDDSFSVHQTHVFLRKTKYPVKNAIFRYCGKSDPDDGFGT